MDKEYNIDEILSEVRKHREENPSPNNEPTPVTEEKPAPAVEDPQIEEPALAEQKQENEFVDLTTLCDESELENAVNVTERNEIDESISNQIEAGKKAEKKKKRKKIIKRVIIAILIIAIVLAAGAGIFVYKALNEVTDTGDEKKPQVEETWKGMDQLIESFDPINETEAENIASLEDMMKQWYYNGNPCSSTHVLNILLVGEDTRGDDIKESGTRADSAMICSINADTGTIHLTSILRDAWAYFETEPGNPESGTFDKINAAMSRGDIHAYINAIEHLYKVDIDNYVIVNFDSFKKIIDKMGGVTLELTSREINEINSHQKRYGNVTIEKTFEGNSGEIKLTGKQALAYCRIRKLDSDNMRANRQKITLTAVAEQARDVSPVTLLKMVNALIPYVKTDMPKSTIVKVAKYALTENWLHYEVSPMNMPDHRIEERGAGGNFSFAGAWIWKADYPQDAYTVQMKVYGKSSITLARTRVDFIECRETGFRADGTSATTATFTNQHYGEATTQETTTKEAE